MRGIARKSVPINVIVHYPKTIEGQRELAERVAGVHADMVNQHIKKLNCPSDQKVLLLDAVIKSASIEKAGEQTP
ncbi:hypothetical protein [Holdemania sp. Marseille-P2844]|uniref:hypothetical protein n=1 Tax=Holdemania sp. Marseille-P2844 TaxID=1852366 RepID=UPI001114917C|nr:hypothetical protein [Holdemania sp. Marseille-P2844]